MQGTSIPYVPPVDLARKGFNETAEKGHGIIAAVQFVL
ncbi:MAG: hypothetical protein CM1200mP28_06680 [Deltaproteobacteria bacterium]|nr:MAG: hypothetical protein CM1200mP28_06680 [Deltaproteobacteria bacterium]